MFFVYNHIVVVRRKVISVLMSEIFRECRLKVTNFSRGDENFGRQSFYR